MRFIPFIALLFIIAFPPVWTKAEPADQAIPYKVTIQMAHELVRTGTGLDYPQGFVDLQKTPDKNGFFIIRGAGKELQIGEFIDNTGKHFPDFEKYYVNAWTGDVWSNCQRLSNPALHEPLAKIKALFQGNELEQYPHLRLIPAYQRHLIEPDTRCKEPDYSATGIAAGESVPYKVNEGMAYVLVQKATKREGGLDSPETPDEDGFFIITRYGNHNGHEGRYGVNAWTGDVWDVESCKRLSSPAARKIQADIKRQFLAGELKQYKHLHDIHAMYTANLEPCP